MKKILASLLVLALCAPAMAATIDVTAGAGADAGKAIVTVTADGAANIVGLGLDVDVTAGNVTAVEIVTANFNIYPDAAYTQELGAGYVYGTGSPVAAKTVPGQINLPQSSFALSFGNLNGAAVAGADGAASVVIKLTLSATANVTVCENATRGGIIAVDGAALEAACDTAAITVGSTFPSCADYNLTLKKQVPPGAVDPVVNVLDLNAFIAYVNGAKNGTTFVVGPTDPDFDPDYNFDSSSPAINVLDLNKMIDFVNTNKTGTTFIVNCSTCGC